MNFIFENIFDSTKITWKFLQEILIELLDVKKNLIQISRNFLNAKY